MKLQRRCVFIKTGEIREQVVYGFISLTWGEIAPGQLLDKIRSVWGIENGLHYRRDVTLRETYTLMTQANAGHVMACLNNLILGILLLKKEVSFPARCQTLFQPPPY